MGARAQAKVFLQTGIFSDYRYDSDEEHAFNISLKVLLDCKCVFSPFLCKHLISLLGLFAWRFGNCVLYAYLSPV
jgi:hypothetical protein